MNLSGNRDEVHANKAQAKGHLAISLQTSSKREARLLSAEVSAEFERAWALAEAHMSETDSENDMLDGWTCPAFVPPQVLV